HRRYFQLAAIENARMLQTPFLRIYIQLTLCESDAEPPTLLHLFLLHLRHSLSSEVQPFSRTKHSIFRLVVRYGSLKSLFNQRERQQAMPILSGLERGLIALR